MHKTADRPYIKSIERYLGDYRGAMDWRYVNQAKSLFGNDLTVKSSSTPTTMDCEYWGEPAETSIFLGLGRNTASMAYPTDNEQYFEHALEASLETVA